MLNNNFSYIQLSFFFLLQEGFYFDPDDIDAFFHFLLQKDFDIFPLPYILYIYIYIYIYSVTIFIYVYNKIMKNVLIAINHFYIYTSK